MRLLAVLGLFAAVVAVAVAAPVKEPRKVIEPAVQARAKRIAVQLGDLAGFGWKVEPSQADRSSPKCSYYDPDQSHLSENGDYTSPDFTRSDGVYVSSSIGIFVSAAHAKTSYAEVVRPELPRCLGEIIAKADRPGKITVRSAGKLSFPRYGDRSAAFRVVFSVKSGKILGRSPPGSRLEHVLTSARVSWASRPPDPFGGGIAPLACSCVRRSNGDTAARP